MKQKSGFTLIELLLVLAIIGIISAIAIPALLGQRARARDKSSMANVSSVIPDLLASYDKIKDSNPTPTTMASIIGTATAPLVPECFTATNPWATGTVVAGYNTTTIATESATDPGSGVKGQVSASNLGQVQLGYLEPVAGTNGVLAAGVQINGTTLVNGVSEPYFIQTAGVD
jgi:prepilin-type N-terminal cleavage/methylation domain-containing protein